MIYDVVEESVNGFKDVMLNIRRVFRNRDGFNHIQTG